MSLATTIEALPDRLEPTTASKVLLWSIIGFTAIMLLWSAFARVDETAIANGRVIPSRQLQVVSNLEGGIVSAILVKPGEKVSAGQVLMRLDPASADGDYGRTSATAQALAARIARLEGEVGYRAPAFPAGLEAAAPAAVAAERSIYTARMADVSAASAAEAAKADGAGRALAEAESDLAVRSEARAQAQREVALIEPLVDKGIEPRIALDRAVSVLSQARSAEAGAGQAVRRARAAVAEARAGQRSVTGKFRSLSVDALASARADMAGQSATLPALKSRVERTEIRAPIAGTVNRVLVATVGGSVRPGEPLVEVVPSGDTLVVEADVRPADIAFVHIGQKASVKLTAYDSAIYGSLSGKVERISPDAIINERTGERHYQVRVRTDQAALKASDGMVLPVGAGMVAQVDIIGHKRSVLSYLLNPVTKFKDNVFREK